MLPIFSLLLVIGGTVNCFLLQPTRIFKRPGLIVWLSCIAAKVVLYVMFSPLMDALLGALGCDVAAVRPPLHAVLALVTLLVSAYAKQVRDEAVQKGDE